MTRFFYLRFCKFFTIFVDEIHAILDFVLPHQRDISAISCCHCGERDVPLKVIFPLKLGFLSNLKRVFRKFCFKLYIGILKVEAFDVFNFLLFSLTNLNNVHKRIVHNLYEKIQNILRSFLIIFARLTAIRGLARFSQYDLHPIAVIIAAAVALTYATPSWLVVTGLFAFLFV